MLQLYIAHKRENSIALKKYNLDNYWGMQHGHAPASPFFKEYSDCSCFSTCKEDKNSCSNHNNDKNKLDGDDCWFSTDALNLLYSELGSILRKALSSGSKDMMSVEICNDVHHSCYSPNNFKINSQKDDCNLSKKQNGELHSCVENNVQFNKTSRGVTGEIRNDLLCSSAYMDLVQLKALSKKNQNTSPPFTDELELLYGRNDSNRNTRFVDAQQSAAISTNVYRDEKKGPTTICKKRISELARNRYQSGDMYNSTTVYSNKVNENTSDMVNNNCLPSSNTIDAYGNSNNCLPSSNTIDAYGNSRSFSPKIADNNNCCEIIKQELLKGINVQNNGRSSERAINCSSKFSNITDTNNSDDNTIEFSKKRRRSKTTTHKNLLSLCARRKDGDSINLDNSKKISSIYKLMDKQRLKNSDGQTESKNLTLEIPSGIECNVDTSSPSILNGRLHLLPNQKAAAEIVYSKDSPDSFMSSDTEFNFPKTKCIDDIMEDFSIFQSGKYNNFKFFRRETMAQRWTPEEEESLVKIYNDYYPTGQWKSVLEKLYSEGINRTRQQCNDKLKNLVKQQYIEKRDNGTYRTLVDFNCRPRRTIITSSSSKFVATKN